eukprot:99272_1
MMLCRARFGRNFRYRPVVQRTVYTLAIDDTGGLYPRNGQHGIDYDLNWSLAKHRVTPFGKAFRNLTRAKLIAHSGFKRDKNKALVVVRNEIPFDELTVDVKGMTRKHFGRALREVRKHLSNHLGIFIQDGKIGVNVRSVSDNPNDALFFSHLLDCKVQQVGRFQAGVTVYNASQRKFDKDDQLKFGIPSSNFIFSDIEKKLLLVVGTVPTVSVESALSRLVGSALKLNSETSVVGEKTAETQKFDYVEQTGSVLRWTREVQKI